MGGDFTDNLKSIIAKNIAELRKENGYTQLSLAEKLNYSDKSISKWERSEALPDIEILKEMADLFGVSLDYMVEEVHKKKTMDKLSKFRKMHNHAFITGICILSIWLVAMIVFVITEIVLESGKFNYLPFLYAVPASGIVWLVLNSVWFNRRRNFLIISFLMWTVLGTIFVTFLFFGISVLKIFLLGIPAQIIIILWSRLKYKKEH